MDKTPNLPRALIVDDDDAVLHAYARILMHAGFSPETARDGFAAEASLVRESFDVILVDIDMPGMDGIELLERVRSHDLDVPVVLITGVPSIGTAIRAIERGALRYLVKPVEPEALAKVAAEAVRGHEIARAKREAFRLVTGDDRLLCDRAGLAASFDRTLASLYIAYQPIIDWSKSTVYAYEALLRSREPSLPNPVAVLDAAERLGHLHQLGRLVRDKATKPRHPLPAGVLLFINLHPADLDDEQLFRPDSALASMAPRVVLEITERASLDGVRDVRARIAALRKLGFRIAVDDFGAGYAGLTSFTLLEPDIVKLDMALVRDVHRDPKKQTVVKTMMTMCKELGILVTCEGIEASEERDALARAGCDLMQGYLFARPGSGFPVPTF